jgi:hypothetical protein
MLLLECTLQPSKPTSKASCVLCNLTACEFSHLWIRSHMHTLYTPGPRPALLWQGPSRVPVPGRSCSVGSASTQGHSTPAAIQQSCVLPLGDHWGCCWSHAWVVLVLHGLRQASLSPGLQVAAATSTTLGSGVSCGAAKAYCLYILCWLTTLGGDDVTHSGGWRQGQESRHLRCVWLGQRSSSGSYLLFLCSKGRAWGCRWSPTGVIEPAW